MGKPVRFGEYQLVRNSVFFDKNFYLNENPDVKAAGADPIVHYLQYGAKEGRNPGPSFSETGYRALNPDVAGQMLSSLEHYEGYGRKESWRVQAPPQPLDRSFPSPPNSISPASVEAGSLAQPSPSVPIETPPALPRLPPAGPFDRYYISPEHVIGAAPAIFPLNQTPIAKPTSAGVTCEEFSARLDSVDVVSFDIFDTALLRNVAHPTSVFDLMGENGLVRQKLRNGQPFADLRVWSERVARDRSVERGGSVEIGLDSIYEVLAEFLKLGLEERDKLKSLELDYERKALEANPTILKWAALAAERGKRIIFVSDMYLPSSFLRETLAAAGYSSPMVFVSNEHGAGKHEGKLYHLVSTLCGASGHRIFHVGDNLRADKTCAEEAGWRAAHYAEAGEALPYPLQLPDTSRLCIENRATTVGIGLSRLHRLAVKAQDLPFHESLAWNIGYEILGPTVLGFAGWVAAQAKRDRLERVVFLSRDGFLPHKVYTLLRESGHAICDARYVWASRRLLYCTAIKSTDDIDAFIPKIHFTRDTTLTEYFDILHINKDELADFAHKLSFGQLDDPIVPHNVKFWEHYTEAHSRLLRLARSMGPTVLQKAATQRDMLSEYYETAIGVNGLSRIGLVDLGWAGSMIPALQLLLNRTNDKIRLSSYFFGLITYAKHNIPPDIPSMGYLFHHKDWNQPLRPLFLPSLDSYQDILHESLPLFEVLFSQNCTTVVDLRRDVKKGQFTPMRSIDSYTPQQRIFLNILHEACLKFAEDALPLLPPTLDSWDFRPLIAHSWMRILADPRIEEARLLGALPHRSDASGRTPTTNLASRRNDATDAAAIYDEWKSAMWPAGWFALAPNSTRDTLLRHLDNMHAASR